MGRGGARALERSWGSRSAFCTTAKRWSPPTASASSGATSGSGRRWHRGRGRARERPPERGGDFLRPALWRERRLSPVPRQTGRRARVRRRRRRPAWRAAHVRAGRLRLHRRARRAYRVTASIAAGHPATVGAGIEILQAQASCLAMLSRVMTMNEGARIYAPGGVLLETGNRLEQPGLVRALELMAEEGAASAYSGSIADALLALMLERGGLVTGEDLETY